MANKKGQAAMEFLMTYGWALLIVLIAIAALAFFGLLNPKTFLPKKADLGPEFQITTVSAGANGITLMVTNGIGQTAYDFQINFTGCQNTTTSAYDGALTTQYDIGAGKTQRVVVECPGLINGTTFESDLIANWTTVASGQTVPHVKEGSVVVDIPDVSVSGSATYGYTG
ncbi:hypothetical protein H6503_02500 [Candidatus Woesearchaeota archaeon]|nr:hypothetical protein [Candidatus Woesearchaeota archaeon]